MKNSLIMIAVIFTISVSLAFGWQAGGMTGSSRIIKPVSDRFILAYTYDYQSKIYSKVEVIDVVKKRIYPPCDIETDTTEIKVHPELNLITYTNIHGDAIVINYKYNSPVFKYEKTYNSSLVFTPDFSRTGDSLIIYDGINNKLIFYHVNTDETVDSLSEWNLTEIKGKGYNIFTHHHQFSCYLWNDTLSIWNVESHEFIKSIYVQYLSAAVKMKFCDDNSKIYFLTDDHHLRVFDLENDKSLADIYKPGLLPYDFELSENGRFILEKYPDESYGYNVNVIDLTTNEFHNPNYHIFGRIEYLNNEGTQCFTLLMDAFICPSTIDLDYGFNYELFDLPLALSAEFKLTYPPNFVGSERNEMLFNVQGSMMCASAPNFRASEIPYNAAIWKISDSSFIKYLKLRSKPLTFSPLGESLMFADDNKIIYHNISSDTDTDSLVTGISNIQNIYVDINDNVLICTNNEKAEVYSYPAGELIKAITPPDTSSEFIRMQRIEGSKLALITKDYKYLIYNFQQGMLDSLDISDIDAKRYEFLDISWDGNFLLLQDLKTSSFVSWDISAKKAVYSTKIPFQASGTITGGFLKENFSMWFFAAGYTITYPFTEAINLATGKLSPLSGEQNFVLSPDNLHYASFECPGNYYYESIPNEMLTGVDDEPVYSNPGISIYPNPVTSILKIKMDVIEVADCEISIINTLGCKVMAAQSGFTPELELNVSNLPAGVYYITISSGLISKRAKFVKI